MSRGAVISKKAIDLIRRVVLDEAGKLGVRVEKIILFGSRARGEAREDSDYDILIVVKGRLDRRQRRELARRIRWRLAGALIPADIIITGGMEWERYRGVVGHLFHAVAEEGIRCCANGWTRLEET